MTEQAAGLLEPARPLLMSLMGCDSHVIDLERMPHAPNSTYTVFMFSHTFPDMYDCGATDVGTIAEMIVQLERDIRCFNPYKRLLCD